MRLLLRFGYHLILRTPAPSCTLLPPTTQVEDRLFACASRADPTPTPICAVSALPPLATAKADLSNSPCPLYPPKADVCTARDDVCFGPKADMASLQESEHIWTVIGP